VIDGPDSRLLALLGTLFAIEGGLYSSITPLLPHYARTLHLSQRALGPLSGAYPAGLIAGALCATPIGRRAGVRTILCLGLSILAGSSLAFGFASRVVLLDVLRFAAGIGAGLVWAAGIAWIVGVAPSEARGSWIGAALGAGFAGTLLGPVMGTLAVGIGIRATFSGIAAAVALATVATARVPVEAPARGPAAPVALRKLLDRRIGVPSWLMCLVGLTCGAINVLTPVRLAHLGSGSAGVGAVFLIAAAVGCGVAPLAGRVADRWGAEAPVRWGLGMAVIVLLLTPLANSVAALSLLTILGLGVVVAGVLSPGGTLLTGAAERLGVGVVTASAMVMLFVSVGEALGPLLATSLAQGISHAAPMAVLAGLSLATLALFANEPIVTPPSAGRQLP
jgi:MFS transporter, DHA1 family, multidrug resistance protein